jgi:hypothetical protein
MAGGDEGGNGAIRDKERRRGKHNILWVAIFVSAMGGGFCE